MGTKKISFALKVNLRATMMVCLAKKVEKEPIRGVVSSSTEDGVHGPVVTKAALLL